MSFIYREFGHIRDRTHGFHFQVAGGTLLASNATQSAGTGAVLIFNGGTVAGSGRLANSSITVQGGGTVQGGTGGSTTATNTLTTGAITLNAGAIFRTILGDLTTGNMLADQRASLIDLGATVLTKGTATSPYIIRLVDDGTLDFNLVYTVTIATYASVGGGLSASDFTAVAENFIFASPATIDVNATSLTVTFTPTPVPEPVTVGLIAAAGLGMGRFIRRRVRK